MIINPTSVIGDRDKCTPLVLLTCPSPKGVFIMKLKYSFLIKAGIKRLFLTLLTSWGYSEHSLLWVQSKAEDCELNLTRGVGTESSWKSCAKPRRKNFPWRCQDWAAPLGRGSWGGCAGAQLSLARLGGSCWKFSCALELGISTEFIQLRIFSLRLLLCWPALSTLQYPACPGSSKWMLALKSATKRCEKEKGKEKEKKKLSQLLHSCLSNLGNAH